MSQLGISSFISDNLVIATMAFLGGFVDSSGFLKLKGLFTSSITGNVVVACAGVSTDSGILARSLCAVAFILAAFVANSAIQLEKTYLKLSHNACLFTAYTLELSLLLATAIFGIIYNDEIDAAVMNDWEVVLPGCLAGAAMGFHCVAVKESFVNCPPTTVVTSTMVNV